jgi:hypothetical protein
MLDAIPTSESDRRARTIIGGAALVASIAGAAGVVLPILGLAGVEPMHMAIAATIALGIGLLIEGGALTTQHRSLIRRTSGAIAAELTGGMTADVLGGLTAVTLGVLALLGASPITLLGLAAVVLGAALMIGAGATAELDRLPDDGHRAWVRVAAVGSAIIGLAGVVLGILVTAGIPDAPLHRILLASLLILGAAELITGAATSTRLVRPRARA